MSEEEGKYNVDTKQLTDERGANYGHPYDHFQCTQGMYSIWRNRYESSALIGPELDKCLSHIVYLICDKQDSGLLQNRITAY